jgi:hypothetical protein
MIINYLKEKIHHSKLILILFNYKFRINLDEIADQIVDSINLDPDIESIYNYKINKFI